MAKKKPASKEGRERSAAGAGAGPSRGGGGKKKSPPARRDGAAKKGARPEAPLARDGEAAGAGSAAGRGPGARRVPAAKRAAVGASSPAGAGSAKAAKAGGARRAARGAALPAPRGRAERPAPATARDGLISEHTPYPAIPMPSREPQVGRVRLTPLVERDSGKYVYCIIATEGSPRFGPIGIGAEPAEVHTVSYRDIAAVVSDTRIEVHDPTRENVLTHERVNETVMAAHSVIPMSFGTVFRTREDIVELLRSAYDAFRDVLDKMEGKVEFGLKVLWDPERVIGELEQEDESLRGLRQEISSQQGSTYFARMQYGRLVDSLLEERSQRYVESIFAALRPVCVASRTNKPIGDRMILNAAFLVALEDEPAFDARVKQIGARLAPLTFKYTGPWPPYNFVNIRLKLERAEDVE